MPLVTLFVPVYNGKKFIGDCISSFLRQRFSDFEVIIFDNCSVDETAELVNNYARTDSRVRMVRHGENLGLIGNFNACLDYPKGKYYSLICHDDKYWSEDALERAVCVLEKDSTINCVYSDLVYIDEQGRILGGRKFRASGVFDPAEVGKRSLLSGRNHFGIPALIRSASIAGLKYDSALEYSADLDLSISLGTRGLPFHIAEPLVANRYHEGNASKSLYKRSVAEFERIIGKHGVRFDFLEWCRFYINGWTTKCLKGLFFICIPLWRRLSSAFCRK